MNELSYARGETYPPLLETTIGATLSATAAEYPDREALVDVPACRRWTYAELLVDVDRLATGLLDAGVRRGDRVGIWSPNGWEWLFMQLATARIGALLVTVNPAYRTHELEYVIKQSGMTMIVSAPRFKKSDYRAMLGEVAPRCPQLREVVCTDTPRWTELCRSAADRPRLEWIESTLSNRDPINIQYTSGTTGSPKGATLTHHNIINGYLVGELLGCTADDRICLPVPFYHCFGMVMGNLAAISHGATIVIPSPGFDAAATLRTVEAERCTVLYGVPTMFIAELGLRDFSEYDLASLRTGIMAGSPCPAQVMRRVIDQMNMPGVAICYGMTETSPVSTQTRSDDSVERRVNTAGRVCPHLEIKIVDPGTGETVPRGVSGEFCTRGYAVMAGYWNDPAATAAAIDDGGWIHSGDVGVMDADGYVSITGRIKDMVIRGGENIYPREIEEVLYTHPDISDAQVIGVPDLAYGEELMAVIIRRAGAPDLTAEEVRRFCADRIAHFKVPRYVRFVEEFPMTVTGKVRKNLLRAQATEELRTK